jgi:hypothetical protein
MSWGVTVVTPVMNWMAEKTAIEGVTQRPMLVKCQSYIDIEQYRVIYEPHGCSEQHKAQHEWASLQQITQWTQKEQANGISSLGDSWDLSDLLIRYIEVVGQNIQDRVIVVQIRHSESSSKGEQDIQSH